MLVRTAVIGLMHSLKRLCSVDALRVENSRAISCLPCRNSMIYVHVLNVCRETLIHASCNAESQATCDFFEFFLWNKNKMASLYTEKPQG